MGPTGDGAVPPGGDVSGTLALVLALAGSSSAAQVARTVARYGTNATGAQAVVLLQDGKAAGRAVGGGELVTEVGDSGADVEIDGAAPPHEVPVVVEGVAWGTLQLRWAPGSAPSAGLTSARLVAELVAGALWRVEEPARTARLAYQDPLTGLANRRSIDDHLFGWSQDREDAPHLGVVVCDVNGLKAVNDRHGHLVGDRHLVAVAELVAAAAARLPGAVAGRLGGDEFVIISPRAVLERVQSVVADLAAAVLGLPHGDGLSCGVASRDHLVREESSESLGRLLLRMADAEQYREKLAGRTSRTTRAGGEGDAAGPRVGRTGAGGGRASPGPADGPGRRSVVHVVREIQRGRAAPGPGGLLHALDLVASTVCALGEGAAWWVSRADATHVWTVSCGTPRGQGDRDGQWPDVKVDRTRYALDTFPVTVSALAGGSFHVSSLDGDLAERRLLAHTGFRSVIGAGGRFSGAQHGPAPRDDQDESGSWLVEVYGDALTRGLAAHETLLAALTTMALTVGAGRGTTGQQLEALHEPAYR